MHRERRLAHELAHELARVRRTAPEPPFEDDVYVAIDGATARGGILALRDRDGDGRAEAQQFFGAPDRANGIAIARHALYVGHRPMGLAQGPDGSLYVSDDRGGRIWRIVYRGQ